MKHFPIFAFILILALAGCGSSNSPCPDVTEPTGPYTISGHITFATPIMLPSDAELIAYWPDANLQPRWPVSQLAFDDSRIFGHGTFDLTNNTWTITFQGIPPGDTTLSGSGCNRISVAPEGYILLVSKSLASQSNLWFSNMALLGAVDSAGMLYHATNYAAHTWSEFAQGYGIGRDSVVIKNGVPPAGDTIETNFVPRSNTGLNLKIDTVSSPSAPAFTFPYNWLAPALLEDKIQ